MKLGVVAGELSGDALGADLVARLREQSPVSLCGVGGPALSAQGLNSAIALDEFSMHGFAEPLRRLPFLWSSLKALEQQMQREQVDAFVGVDFNVFNFLLEARLKKRGIPVVHYVSPSVYAWRRGRTRRVARSCDLLLTLFPFEPPLYDEVRAVFVGHPLADAIPLQGSPAALAARQAARELFAVADSDSVVAVLPGSRMSEVRHMLEPFLRAALLVQQQRPRNAHAVALCDPGH